MQLSLWCGALQVICACRLEWQTIPTGWLVLVWRRSVLWWVQAPPLTGELTPCCTTATSVCRRLPTTPASRRHLTRHASWSAMMVRRLSLSRRQFPACTATVGRPTVTGACSWLVRIRSWVSDALARHRLGVTSSSKMASQLMKLTSLDLRLIDSLFTDDVTVLFKHIHPTCLLSLILWFRVISQVRNWLRLRVR